MGRLATKRSLPGERMDWHQLIQFQQERLMLEIKKQNISSDIKLIFYHETFFFKGRGVRNQKLWTFKVLKKYPDFWGCYVFWKQICCTLRDTGIRLLAVQKLRRQKWRNETFLRVGWDTFFLVNRDKRQKHLVEFLVFNSSFGRHMNWLIPIASPSNLHFFFPTAPPISCSPPPKLLP